MRGGPIDLVLFAIVVGLLLLALFFQVAVAVKAGLPFYGINYKGQPLGVAYPIVIALIFGGVGLAVGFGKLWSVFKRWRSR